MSDQRPNVVLVSIDSLRADHCGHLGDDDDLTPTLDALAADGVAFRNAVAPGPQTFSSMPVAFTGEYRPPNSLDATVADDHWTRRMAAIDRHVSRYETIPERLSRRGYDTAGFSPNPWTSTISGFDRGFDHFVDISDGDDTRLRDRIAERLFGPSPDRKALELAKHLVTGSSFFAQWDSFYDDVRECVADLEEPYFLWVFLMDTHFPFVTTRKHRVERSALGMYYNTARSQGAMRGTEDSMPKAVARSTRASYRDTVRAADDFLDAITTDLAADDPVTVVHSDHGESFGDHGNYGHHHRCVYEENVHVPFVVHGADVRASVDRPTSLAALPDIIDDVADTGTFDPMAASSDVAVASSEGGRHRAARGERFKFVDDDGDEVLYDLLNDPRETEDASAGNGATRRRLARTLRTHDDHLDELARLDRATRTVATAADL
ncbi:sulfatase-like hydrolase/transferase [Halorubellus sp. JP-L1]|uniref:sulfatase-like hydrolase/transferase n=1 Tax=Halorubellus sp. JP-L1 TaxID=2715753 RepID=UPI0014075F4D|nr:sulfatase-like hydrolase/transferase [Halorubellus sp. JP-L1]NHN43191.1 sulfatase-like hydrolase/transferase [Halorubellus sp. JP-L1]